MKVNINNTYDKLPKQASHFFSNWLFFQATAKP